MRDTVSMKADHDPVIQERAARLAAAFSDDREELLMADRPRLRRLAQLQGPPPDPVADVVQETLLQACEHLHGLHSHEVFHTCVDESCRELCRPRTRKTQ